MASSHSSDLVDRSWGGFGAHGACRGGVKCIWQGEGGKLLKFSACVGGDFCFSLFLIQEASEGALLKDRPRAFRMGISRQMQSAQEGGK